MTSPPPAPDFQPLPDRDAWATIRGFLYQMEITLLRWLDLAHSEHLALECGEDVDRISPAILNGAKDDRLLEQVKYRERNITLRSREAVEALASFHAQRELNPEISLRFRFLSNASPGQELSMPLPATSGIRLWSELQRGALSATETTTAVEGIRTLLQSAIRPEGFDKQRWEKFHAFIASSSVDGLFEFVAAFEWGMEAGDINDVQADVRQKLVELGRASPGSDARRKHGHLLVHVLRTLAQSGEKRLTAGDLIQVINAPGLASIDEDVLQRLNELRELLLSRIDDVGRHVDENLKVTHETLQVSLKTHDVLHQFVGELNRLRAPQVLYGDSRTLLLALAQQMGMTDTSTAFATSDHVDTEPPPLVSRVSLREETIKSLLGRVGEKTWCALHGGSGTGKTQLAILAVTHAASKCIWLRLRDLEPAEAAHRIHRVLDTIIQSQDDTESVQDWSTNLSAALGRGALVVLDDLPQTDGHSALDEVLAHVCAACRHAEVRLLTTAHRPLPSVTRSLVAEHLHEETVPLLLDKEIKDIFLQHGASERFMDANVLQFVKGISRQHPVLVVEAARFLQADGWTWNNQTFDALLKGSYASGLETATVEHVRRTVQDEKARELLYRIKLIGWWFTEEQVQWLGEVEPAISLPLEKFTDLVGFWIQRDSNTRYLVSPLIASLASTNLSQEQQRRVHLALARGIMSKGRIGPEEAFQAITHFAAADCHKEAAFVLQIALHGILEERRAVDYLGITGIWADMPLPESIPHTMKISLRSLQAIVRHRNGKDIAYLLDDFDRLVAEREPEPKLGFVLIGAGGMLASTLVQTDPTRATRYLAVSLQAARDKDLAARSAGGVDLREGLLGMLWMTGTAVTTEEQFEAWFTAVRELTVEEARQWADLPLAAKLSELVCNGIWLRADEAPAKSELWPGVIKVLERVRDWALNAGVISMVVHSVRGLIIVVAEYQQDLARAVAIAHAFLAAHRQEPKAKFWISEIVARQFYYQRRPEEALRWFEEAFSAEAVVDSGSRASALLVAGAAASPLSSSVSLAYLQRAVALVESISRNDLVPFLASQAWGELGIALWSASERRSAYDAWSRAVEELLATKDDTDERRILFQVMANCSGYFSLMSQSREPSPWPYAVPEGGMLLRWPRAVLPFYKPGMDWRISMQMTLLADGLGDYDGAVRWAARSMEHAGVQLEPGIDIMMQSYRLPQLLDQGRFADIVVQAAVSPRSPRGEASAENATDEQASAARFAQMSGRLALLAVAIELTRRSLKDPELAGTLARNVSALCHEAAARPDVSPWWAAAGDAIASLTTGDLNWKGLYERAVGLRDSDPHLSVAYDLAAMLRAAPQDAVQLQMVVLLWLKSLFSKTLFHFTMARLITEYWAWALDQYPAHFGHPHLVRSSLEDAGLLQDEGRLRMVLRTVTTSLGTTPATPEMRQWLFGEK